MSSSGPQERPAEGTARSVVLWGGLALLSVLALAGWWATRTVRLPREFREPEDPEAQDLAEPLPGPTPAVEAAPLGSGVDPAAHGRDEPGVVIVRVQDAESGEPLAGIEVEVGCEEPVRRSFGRRLTASDGSVRFPGVSVPVALAATRRSELYCAALTVARGGLDGARVATLRLVPGGVLRGRVVDDRGLPVADAALSLTDPTPWPEPVLDPRPVARSRADGSFEIERVRDQPRLVTTRQGSFFAAAWAPVQVQARGLGGTAQGVVSVAPCGEARIADLVLPRPPTFVGRVFDFDGRPVAGALVSGHPRRFLARDVNLHVAAPDRVADGLADLPGSPLFQLLEGEVLTGPDGAFELTAAPSRAVLLVAAGGALRGMVQEFPCGAFSSGARLEGIELRLDDGEVFRARLFDDQGRPVLGRAPSPVEEPPEGEAPHGTIFGRAPVRFAPLSGPATGAWVQSRVRLLILDQEGVEWERTALPDGQGVFAFAIPGRLASLERLTILAPGFEPAVLECKGRLRPEPGALDLRLVPLARVALSLVLADAPDSRPAPGESESEPYDVTLRVCGLAPQPVTAGGAPRPPCCGSGMAAWFPFSGPRGDVDVPVTADLPYWITVRLSRGRRSEEHVAGPFRPGLERVRIEVPAFSSGSQGVGGPSPAEQERASAGRTDPRAAAREFSGGLCVFDAVSGAPVEGATLWCVCDPLGRETLRGRTWFGERDGCLTLDGLSEGSWTFAVSAPGHRTALLGPLELRAPPDTDPALGLAPELGPEGASGELDLGMVQLAPVD
jgi:hypothetical protein